MSHPEEKCGNDYCQLHPSQGQGSIATSAAANPENSLFCPPLYCVLQKGKKCGDSIKNPCLTHHQTSVLVSPAVRHRLVFFLGRSFKSIQMADVNAPELPRDLREGDLVLTHNMPG